jgi:hypothetical protein
MGLPGANLHVRSSCHDLHVRAQQHPRASRSFRLLRHLRANRHPRSPLYLTQPTRRDHGGASLLHAILRTERTALHTQHHCAMRAYARPWHTHALANKLILATRIQAHTTEHTMECLNLTTYSETRESAYQGVYSSLKLSSATNN